MNELAMSLRTYAALLMQCPESVSVPKENAFVHLHRIARELYAVAREMESAEIHKQPKVTQ
jgi:hypothetical protein